MRHLPRGKLRVICNGPAVECERGERDRQAACREVNAKIMPRTYPWARARPIVAPPSVPPERVAALRAAYHAAMNDPKFIADAKRMKIEIVEVSSERIIGLVKTANAMPPKAITAAREAMNLTGAK